MVSRLVRPFQVFPFKTIQRYITLQFVMTRHKHRCQLECYFSLAGAKIANTVNQCCSQDSLRPRLQTIQQGSPIRTNFHHKVFVCSLYLCMQLIIVYYNSVHLYLFITILVEFAIVLIYYLLSNILILAVGHSHSFAGLLFPYQWRIVYCR